MNHKLKNIIISSYDDLKNPVYSGGGAVAVHEIAKRLAADYNVTVITGTYQGAKNETTDKVKYMRVGSDMFGHKIGQLIFQAAILRHLPFLKYDLWIESTTPPVTFSLLPLFSAKPVISWVNMLSGADMHRKYFFDFRIPERFLARFYRNFIVPTSWVHDEIQKMNEHALVSTIPCGYNSSKTSGKKKTVLRGVKGGVSRYKKSKYILFIGRIEVNQKGIDLLLQALKQASRQIKLVIAGSGSAKEEAMLNDMIKKEDLSSRVIRYNKVTGEDKEKLFNNAVAVVIPSRYETFSLVALESAAHRKPVICFNIPQLSWIPDTYAYKVPAFDINKFAQAIDRLAKLRATILPEHSVKPFLNQYKWNSIALRFTTVINRNI